MTRRAYLFAVAVVVLVAFNVPMAAQTPEIEELRARAKAGDALAQSELGVMYATGEGVPQDDVTAHMWFNLAASRSTGDLRDRAVQNRDFVAEQLTAVQRAEAQRLAREWDAAHPRD